MPLPAFLSSSYQQYKEDQKVFTTWLYQAARTCGYKSDIAREPTSKAPKTAAAAEVLANPTQRLKGKARKLAKQAPVEPVAKPLKSVRYSMSIAELTKSVQAISQSAKGRTLPASVQTVLQSAIAARKRCAEWYTLIGADATANAGHRHFIGILQNALHSLKPQDGTGASGNGPTLSSDVKLSNQFEALRVEEPNDEYPITAAEISTPGPKADNERDIYELDEQDADFEVTFRLYCFFEDLHTIQTEIKKAWQLFAQGQVGLKTATLVTQAGIDMVKRLEEQQPSRDNSCEHHGSKHPHINLSLPVFYADAMMAGEDPEELLNTPKALEHREFYEFIYLPTARTLMKFADVAHQVRNKVAWPFPVMPMRFSYIVRPELLELPGYKQLEEDDRVLTQMLLDVFLIEDSKEMMQKQHMSDNGSLPELHDEFAKSARMLWEKGTVSTYAVFTSRIVLDILAICGGSARPQFARGLREEGQMAADTMQYINEDGILDTREVRWLAKDQQLGIDLHRLITIHIPNVTFPYLKGLFLDLHAKQPKGGPLEESPPEVQAAWRKRMIERGLDPDDGPTDEHKRNAKNLKLKPIEPSHQKDFLQTHNAMHCGSLSLALTSKMEEAGIALANHHMSIFAVAHLYNAFQQLAATEIKWPEMNRVIDLHVGALFANDIPKTPADFHRRLAYRTGVTGVTKDFDKKQPWKFRAGAASASLRELLHSKGSVEKALLQLETQIEEHATSQAMAQKKNSPTRRRQLKPAQIMTRFQEYLPVVMKDMELNYVTLTKTCNALIKAVRDALRDELGLRIPSSQQPGDSHDHSVVAVVLLILAQNQESAAAHVKRKDRSAFKGGDALKVACKTFEAFFILRILPTLSQGSSRSLE